MEAGYRNHRKCFHSAKIFDSLSIPAKGMFYIKNETCQGDEKGFRLVSVEGVAKLNPEGVLHDPVVDLQQDHLQSFTQKKSSKDQK